MSALLLVGGAAPPEARPQEPFLSGPQEEVAASPSAKELRAKFTALEDEYDEAAGAWQRSTMKLWEAHQKAGKPRDEFEVPEAIEPSFFPKFDALAKAGSIDATMWCLSNYVVGDMTPSAARADKLERLRMVLGDSPSEGRLSVLIGVIGAEISGPLMPEDGEDKPSEGEKPFLTRETALSLMEEIREKSESDDTKALSLYTTGSSIDVASYFTTDEKELAAINAESAKWYRRVAAEYPETEHGQRCVGIVFAAENLQIGMVAPDIVGKDHDGNDISRSDFAGKVTVIDFWGFW